MAAADVFSAIANPTRRRILDLLRVRDRPAGEIVDSFPALPQPAVSRHLRVLREAGLVDVAPRAQMRIYSLSPDRLRQLDSWISHYREFWTDRLSALSDHLDRDRAERATGHRERP